MTVSFTYAVADYVGNYLPNTRRSSNNTIRSYCEGLAQFMEFAEGRLGIGVGQIGPRDLTYELFCDYVGHLLDKGLSKSTVNQRMAVVKSFMKWLARTDLSYLAAKEAICDVKPLKAPDPSMAWLTIEEVKTILSLPDASTSTGLRDLAMLVVLYDAAARAQEVCNLEIGDVNTIARTITLFGKGEKTRTVPLDRQAVKILKAYTGSLESQDARTPLFCGRLGGRITPSGIQYIIAKYVDRGRKITDGRLFDKTVTAHVFRHSKAMHILEAGVELIYIRDFLGHASVRTTEVYARANPEAKRAAILRHAEAVGVKPKRMSRKAEEDTIAKVRAIGRSSR
ncbi:MAG: tyrosine-type recombinase/integrase [Eggerthellales bacterium]|nr:tyrosine-type recombinase/integrase [Eggerthellales bacterium]